MNGPSSTRHPRPSPARQSRAPFVEGLNWIRTAPAAAALLAVVVGAGAGLGAVVFRALIELFTRIATGNGDPAALLQHTPRMVLLAPVLGGLLYGPLIARFAPEARGHGVPEVMDAVRRRGGRIAPRVVLVKSLASALCIGSGGSVGREGPIVQVGAALGSTVGGLAGLSERRMRLLVACGAAGGISATFNTPIAGVFFALELILGSFETELVAVVVLASVTADVIGRAAFGDQAFLVLPPFRLASPVEYLFYLGLGALAVVVGVLFVHALYAIEDGCERFLRVPSSLRPALGGVGLAVLVFAVPELYGVGYPALTRAVDGRYVLGVLVLLLVGKVIATSLTIGIGGSGGVFAPSLFIGAMLGTAYGQAVHDLVPQLTASPAGYGLVGMGAVFAASTRAPVTALVIVFELTDQYAVILPLMLAIAVATAGSRLLSEDTIYTLKLRRRGVDLGGPARPEPFHGLTVAAAMRGAPAPLVADAPMEEAIEQLLRARVRTLPVAAAGGELVGVVSRADLERALVEDQEPPPVGRLARPVRDLFPDDPLERAAQLLAEETDALPVLDSQSGGLVGWITDRDVLAALVRARSDSR